MVDNHFSLVSVDCEIERNLVRRASKFPISGGSEIHITDLHGIAFLIVILEITVNYVENPVSLINSNSFPIIYVTIFEFLETENCITNKGFLIKLVIIRKIPDNVNLGNERISLSLFSTWNTDDCVNRASRMLGIVLEFISDVEFYFLPHVLPKIEPIGKVIVKFPFLVRLPINWEPFSFTVIKKLQIH